MWPSTPGNSPTSGGGWQALAYTFRKAGEAGGLRSLWKAMRTRNACKTCALGMGGQSGGMVNEAGHFPEVCKKSLQAMVSDMQSAIPDAFWATHPVDRLRSLSPRQLEHAGRLARPVVRRAGQSRYAPVSWDEALEAIAEKLAATPPDESFFYFSGRSSNEAGFLLQLLARAYGTNNVNNCSFYCHQASGVGLSGSLGTGTATVVLEDLDKADLVFVVGANPASNHPRLMTSLMHLRRRGGKVIVVNPVREPGLERFKVPSDIRSMLFGTRVASRFVQPRPGGDLAFFTGLAKAVFEMGAEDQAFLDGWCASPKAFRAHVERLSWTDIEASSGVSREEILATASDYATAERVVFSWAMGITHHTHGTASVQAMANLALIRGMVGKPGAGLMPIRGHSNVQGMGSMGVTPELKKQIFDGMEEHLGIQLPTRPGRDTLACMEAAAEGHMRFALCLGGNLYGSNPDSAFAAQALQQVETVVYLSTTLNTGHAHGTGKDTWILPVLAWDEEPEPTTQESMFNYVRMSDGGPARIAGARPETDVIATLGASMGSAHPWVPGAERLDWTTLGSTEGIRRLIGTIVPGYGAIADIDTTKEEFQIAGRTFHTPGFPTPDGKARLLVHPLPEPPSADDGTLTLMTIRSEGQFNTVVYEEEDLYRGQTARDVILVHPDTAAAQGLRDGQRVRVNGPAGTMPNIRVSVFDRIRPGAAAMYFPESNILLDRIVDTRSRTPAFKSVPVVLES
ncbi:MAG: FdhF/YdeP family oxidoreductase [Rhodothermales bacterium]